MRTSFFFLLFFVDWDLCSGLHSGKAGTWKASAPVHFALFWRWSPMNYLPGLALNNDTPKLASKVARIPGASHWHLACFLS
jgi:ABC-type sugar transport system permease subunit